MLKLKENIPTTLAEAILLIVESLTEAEREYIQKNSYGGMFHHTIGMNVRNSWGLWKKNSPIVQDVKAKYGIFGHGDDCSGLIFTGVWAAVRGQCIQEALQKEADGYISHWKREGIDPKTGEEIKGFKRPKSITYSITKL